LGIVLITPSLTACGLASSHPFPLPHAPTSHSLSLFLPKTTLPSAVAGGRATKVSQERGGGRLHGGGGNAGDEVGNLSPATCADMRVMCRIILARERVGAVLMLKTALKPQAGVRNELDKVCKKHGVAPITRIRDLGAATIAARHCLPIGRLHAWPVRPSNSTALQRKPRVSCQSKTQGALLPIPARRPRLPSCGRSTVRSSVWPHHRRRYCP
jgi:hypothetical protein